MGEPIKPSNEVVLGGVRFDANNAENYGRNVGATEKEVIVEEHTLGEDISSREISSKIEDVD